MKHYDSESHRLLDEENERLRAQLAEKTTEAELSRQLAEQRKAQLADAQKERDIAQAGREEWAKRCGKLGEETHALQAKLVSATEALSRIDLQPDEIA